MWLSKVEWSVESNLFHLACLSQLFFDPWESFSDPGVDSRIPFICTSFSPGYDSNYRFVAFIIVCKRSYNWTEKDKECSCTSDCLMFLAGIYITTDITAYLHCLLDTRLLLHQWYLRRINFQALFDGLYLSCCTFLCTPYYLHLLH